MYIFDRIKFFAFVGEKRRDFYCDLGIGFNTKFSLIFDLGIFHLTDYEDKSSTVTSQFQSISKKFFNADLDEKTKIVSCGIPPREGTHG